MLKYRSQVVFGVLCIVSCEVFFVRITVWPLMPSHKLKEAPTPCRKSLGTTDLSTWPT